MKIYIHVHRYKTGTMHYETGFLNKNDDSNLCSGLCKRLSNSICEDVEPSPLDQADIRPASMSSNFSSQQTVQFLNSSIIEDMETSAPPEDFGTLNPSSQQTVQFLDSSIIEDMETSSPPEDFGTRAHQQFFVHYKIFSAEYVK